MARKEPREAVRQEVTQCWELLHNVTAIYSFFKK